MTVGDSSPKERPSDKKNQGNTLDQDLPLLDDPGTGSAVRRFCN
jgi:hypothetical protein